MYHLEKIETSEYDKHQTYKVRKGDTLQAVARELGVEAQELRRYHNIYCPIQDLIEADFKNHLELVILAPEKKEVKTNEGIARKLKKISLANDFRLPFLPERINENYKIQYTSEVGDEIDITEMKISVKWLAVDNNRYHLFEIDRASEIYINGKAPDTMMSELALKAAEVLYPLKIVVNEYGKWIDIHNYNEIENRWGRIKREILDYYEGEVAEAYIEHTENALENSETLLASISSDYFLRVFFNGIHLGYTSDYSFKNEISFPLEKEEESMFKVQQKIAQHLDDSDLIKVEQKGDYIDLSDGIQYGYAPWKGNYNAAFFLNSDSYCIEKINLECSIEYDEPLKITVHIELLQEDEIKSNS
ncbi:LysM peptidoglycan-binding domain-containing protein [Flavobacterium sp. 5]|uniref:LysM peptidoglycan-binding domain-containing protein n=1 Tax=Flavobacterium sp. 5 TaxID=2035199 RepID=UPI000C2CCB62|nr:LysM peptidoglycan-binding domain-containing protein [Flavobacterium sp. 5]PKB18732.1 LysM domain-containing protein [Flavobacterium sp. 5]